MKAVLRATPNEFHAWEVGRLPARFVITDIDTWPLAISDAEDDYRPLALVELKRSFIPPEEWRPFSADRSQYAALLALARQAGIPLWVIYFQKGQPIGDDSRFALFWLVEAVPEYHGRRKVITAAEFARRFPAIWNGQ